MSTQTTTVPGSFAQSDGISPALQAFYWSIRRELWENRSLYLAPLIAAVVFLSGFLISLFTLRHRFSSSQLNSEQLREALTTRLDYAAALIMVTAFVVGIFYTVDALYGERRDRSILFWKSLPVSDVTTVLSKFTIPIVVVPVASFAITLLAQFCMLLVSSVMLVGSGAETGAVWTGPFLRDSAALFYHLLTIHGFWYAPLYAWVLLVSAWAPRLPFLWAFFPPFVIGGLEKITFNTTHFFELLQYRLMGPGGAMAPEPSSHDVAATPIPHHVAATLIPHHFFSTPGLWTGLVVAVGLVFLTVRVRRYRGPI